MILGALLAFAAGVAFFAVSERLAERYVAALPPAVVTRLPNKRAFMIGPIRYSLARRRLLRIPVADPKVERLRRRALFWGRWWPWIYVALFVPFVLLGVALSVAGIGIGVDSLPPYDVIRTAIQVFSIAGLALYVGWYLWKRWSAK